MSPFAAVVLVAAAWLCGCAHTGNGAPDMSATRTERTREIEALKAAGTADTLAVAAWLSQVPPIDLDPAQSLDLIGRASFRAPDRPEIVWLRLAICRRVECDAEDGIEAQLKALDPTNGFAFAPDLERAYASGSETAITDAVSKISAATKASDYWSQIVVMIFDALAIAAPSQGIAVRGVEAIGMAAAIPVPGLQAMSQSCRLERLDQPGRRAACEALVARLEQSSTVLTQSLALSIEERWSPPGSPQREALQRRRRRIDYLMLTSAAVRWGHLNRDMEIRMNAARHSEREEDVDIALMKSRGLPLDPPAHWKDTWHPS